MKQLSLTQGKFALVDDEDFEYLNQFKWCYDGKGYAVRRKPGPGSRNYGFIWMHRVVNNTLEGMDTDHINRDKLDNRRSNLRTASRTLNNHNRLPAINNVSGIRGVSFNK